MSRTLSAGMVTHLAGNSHTRAKMILLELNDGTSYGMTTHNKPVTFDLDSKGSLVYQNLRGLKISDYSTGSGFKTGTLEVSGALTSTLTLEDVLSGYFRRAIAYYFEVNWAVLGDGPIRIARGSVAQIEPVGNAFVLQIRDDKDRFNQKIGRLITNLCSADYGDAQCTATVETLAGTVDAVDDELQFTVTFAGTFADDYFNLGKVEFTSGDLNGSRKLGIIDWTSAGVITLRQPLPKLPAVGDTLTIYRGCPKTREGCMVRGAAGGSNILNMRAFPEVPSSDQVLKYQIPGA